MSLAVAIPCGLAAAVAYGVSTAVQHDAANTGTGSADARGLLLLLRDRRWLMSVGGDALGLLLQIVALATGPVVLIQPLLVLAIVVALPVGWRLGGPRPGRAEGLGCLAVLAGLAVFFVLAGDPGAGTALGARAAAWTVVAALIVVALAAVAVRGRSAPLRAGVLGAAAGGLFGMVGVLLNVVALAYADHGVAGFGQPAGWIPLGGVLVAGAAAMTLTQVSFQIGELSASFPAIESAGPVVAVLLGATLLHEHLPLSAPKLAVYLLCLAAVVAGTIRLARAGAARQG